MSSTRRSAAGSSKIHWSFFQSLEDEMRKARRGAAPRPERRAAAAHIVVDGSGGGVGGGDGDVAVEAGRKGAESLGARRVFVEQRQQQGAKGGGSVALSPNPVVSNEAIARHIAGTDQFGNHKVQRSDEKQAFSAALGKKLDDFVPKSGDAQVFSNHTNVADLIKEEGDVGEGREEGQTSDVDDDNLEIADNDTDHNDSNNANSNNSNNNNIFNAAATTTTTTTNTANNLHASAALGSDTTSPPPKSKSIYRTFAELEEKLNESKRIAAEKRKQRAPTKPRVPRAAPPPPPSEAELAAQRRARDKQRRERERRTAAAAAARPSPPPLESTLLECTNVSLRLLRAPEKNVAKLLGRRWNLAPIDTLSEAHSQVFIVEKIEKKRGEENKRFAIKRQFLGTVNETPDLQLRAYRELRILMQLNALQIERRCYHFVSLIDFVKSLPPLLFTPHAPVNTDEVFLYLVLEYGKRDLHTLLREQRALPLPLFRHLLFQILWALLVAQQRYRFVHNDFHFKNILVQDVPDERPFNAYRDAAGNIYYTQHFVVKITDFGLSRARLADNTIIHNPKDTFAEMFDPARDINSLDRSLSSHLSRLDMAGADAADVAAFKSLRKLMKKVTVTPAQCIAHDFFKPLKLRPDFLTPDNTLMSAVDKDQLVQLYQALRQPDATTLLLQDGLKRLVPSSAKRVSKKKMKMGSEGRGNGGGGGGGGRMTGNGSLIDVDADLWNAGGGGGGGGGGVGSLSSTLTPNDFAPNRTLRSDRKHRFENIIVERKGRKKKKKKEAEEDDLDAYLFE